MQLKPLVVSLALLVPLLASPARGDDAVVGSVDTFVYTDTDNVLIISPQAGVTAKLDDAGGQVSARAVVDIVSAASVDVVTEATPRFSEVRKEADLGVSKRFGVWLPSAHYRYSTEPDYLSNGFGVGLERPFAGHDTTLSATYDLTLDTVERSGTPTSVFSKPLTTHSTNVSVTQVVGPRTVVRAVYSFTLQDGFMEKPYRYVPLFDQAGLDRAAADGVTLNASTFGNYRLAMRPTEEVPDRRVRHALGVRALRYLPDWGGSVRADYRLYLDDWGLVSHTGEVALRLPWRGTREWSIADRAYWQPTGASFWRKEYVVTPGTMPQYRTVDKDLSPFASDTLELGFTSNHGGWSWYALGSGMLTKYSDYLFLNWRFAATTEVGVRVNL